MSRILLVDDEEMNRDMLSRRLKKRGYEIITAGDGAEACDKAASESPDLILLDMKMPVMDGYDAARNLKSSDGTQNIPIIGLTAFAMQEDREKVLQAGCDEYESKPVQFGPLVEKMEALLGRDRDEGS